MGAPATHRGGPWPARTPDAVTWLTMYVVVLFAVPSWLVLGPLGSAGALAMLVGLLSFGIWVLTRLVRRTPVAEPVQGVKVALGVFLFCVGVSYVVAMAHPISPDEISPATVALLALVSWSGTLLLTADGVSSHDRAEALVWRLVLMGGILAALGLVQFFTAQLLVDRISVPGLAPLATVGIAIRNGLVRPQGTALSPIEFGALMGALVPLAFHVGFWQRHRPAVLRWAPLLVICMVVAASSSRSAYVGSAVGVAACLFGWSAAQRRLVICLAVLGVGAVFVAAPRLLSSVTGMFTGAEDDPSIQSRTDSYAVAWHFVARHPFFGHGLGTFLPKYRIFDNEYLLLLVSVGIVGTVAFGGVAVATFVQLARVYRRSASPRTRDLTTSLIGAAAAGFAGLAFFDAFAFPMTMGIIFLVLGLACAVSRLEPTTSAGARQAPYDDRLSGTV